MFKTVHFIQSSVVGDGSGCTGYSNYGMTPARVTRDSLVFRGEGGDQIRIHNDSPQSDTHLIVNYVQNVSGIKTSYTGRMRDEVLARRIIRYMSEYYGERHTNCSTLAEYLRTGVFSECDLARRSLMFTRGLNRYSGEKVRAGDTICVLYLNGRVAGSRVMSKEVRNHYRKVRGGGYHTDFRRLTGPRKVISSEQLFDLYNSGVCDDYHFLYCIGSHNGQPVCIQQLGRDEPKKRNTPDPITDVLITAGMYEMYPDQCTPGYVFIKRGR